MLKSALVFVRVQAYLRFLILGRHCTNNQSKYLVHGADVILHHPCPVETELTRYSVFLF